MAIPEYKRPTNGADAKDVLTPVVGDGSNIFDHEENRNDIFSETTKTRNTITHVPYRGNEQHGVEFNTPAEDFTPYESEENAEKQYTSSYVTPRDIVPMTPVPVQIIDNPNLLNTKHARAQQFTIRQGQDYGNWIQLVQSMRTRTRLIISVASSGSGTVQGYLCPNNSSPTLLESMFWRTAAQTLVLLDSTMHDGVWINVQYMSGADAIISVYQEYIDYEGQPLL